MTFASKLKNIKKTEIAKCDRFALLAEKSYFPGSLVNSTVVGVTAAQTLASWSCSEQFKKQGKYLIQKLKLLNKFIGNANKEKGLRYSSPLNQFTKNVTDKFGRSNTIIIVSNKSITAFKKAVALIDPEAISDSDLQKIALDFDILCQGFVESAIDSAKDKSKAFNAALADFMTMFDKNKGYKITLRSRLYKMGLYEFSLIREERTHRLIIDSITPDSRFISLDSEMSKITSIFDADPKDKKDPNNGKKIVIEDSLALASKTIHEESEATLHEYFDGLLEVTEDKILGNLQGKTDYFFNHGDKLRNLTPDERNLVALIIKLNFVLKAAKRVLNKKIIFGDFCHIAFSKEEKRKHLKALRSVAYKLHEKANVKTPLIKAVIMAGCLYNYGNKKYYAGTFSFFNETQEMFPMEFGAFLTDPHDGGYPKSLRLSIVYNNIDILKGSQFFVTNGVCNTVDEDGNNVRIVLKEKYTGSVLACEDGLYPEDVDFISEYDDVDFIILENPHYGDDLNICKMKTNTKEKKEEYLEALNKWEDVLLGEKIGYNKVEFVADGNYIGERVCHSVTIGGSVSCNAAFAFKEGAVLITKTTF